MPQILKSYTRELFRSKCMSGAQRVHCHAALDTDIREVLPYLNAELGGTAYTRDPPSVTFQVHGKLITIHADKIAVNALKDEAEADKILNWLMETINETWARREEIVPLYEVRAKPVLLEILKRLPKTNCRECREATCMVFAARVVEGVRDETGCPGLTEENRKKLKTYLSGFSFD